jgi:hypothetical protein
MPCRCEGYEDSTEDVLRAKIDELTQNMCFLCASVPKTMLTRKASQRILDWWKQHQADDTERVTEAIRAYVVKHPRTMATNIANRFIRDAEAVHPLSDYHKNWFYDIAKKEVDRYRKNKKRKSGLKASVTSKLSASEIDFIRKHKV